MLMKQPGGKCESIINSDINQEVFEMGDKSPKKREKKKKTVKNVTAQPTTQTETVLVKKHQQENPQELQLLFKELLIGVIGVFRDPEAPY